jgi:hypothetical protein
MTSLYIIESGLIHASKPQAATITNLRASEGFRSMRRPRSSTVADAMVVLYYASSFLTSHNVAAVSSCQ